MNLNEKLMSHEADERTFGQIVRERRTELGKSVRGFASDLGITPAYVSDIEKGNRYAPKSKLELIFKLLQFPLDQHQAFMDLAAMTRGEFEDINPYLKSQYRACLALRKAKEKNISDERWQEIIQLIES